MKRFSLYYTPSHASVTIQNGATRETSASTMAVCLAAMPREDRAVLVAFCRAVIATAESGFPFELEADVVS